jgi:hypothetical protein
MSHRGGGGVGKGPKKCCVLFEWPLIFKIIYSQFTPGKCPKDPTYSENNLLMIMVNFIYICVSRFLKSGTFDFVGFALSLGNGGASLCCSRSLRVP